MDYILKVANHTWKYIKKNILANNVHTSCLSTQFNKASIT